MVTASLPLLPLHGFGHGRESKTSSHGKVKPLVGKVRMVAFDDMKLSELKGKKGERCERFV
jgi:hypothetical protein